MLIRRSFYKVACQPDLVAELFYQHLFEIAPACKIVCVCELRSQGRRLVEMLAVMVVGLNTPETLIPVLQAMGQRHTGYGATIEDYRAVGMALIYSLQKSLGADFTPEVHHAWLVFYAFVTEIATNAPV